MSLLVDGFLGLSRATAGQPAAPAASPDRGSTAVEPAGTARTQPLLRLAPLPGEPQRPQPQVGGENTWSRRGGRHRLLGLRRRASDAAGRDHQSSPAVPRAVAEVMKRSTRKSLVVELLIDERGDVEDATIVEAVLPVYDLLVLRSARQWKYRPAQFDGVPVRYRSR